MFTQKSGDFAEHLILYWLSKYGYESARVDHTGIDLTARNKVLLQKLKKFRRFAVKLIFIRLNRTTDG
jgi:hypothetical protein